MFGSYLHPILKVSNNNISISLIAISNFRFLINNFMQIFVEIWSTGNEEQTFGSVAWRPQIPQFILSTPLIKFFLWRSSFILELPVNWKKLLQPRQCVLITQRLSRKPIDLRRVDWHFMFTTSHALCKFVCDKLKPAHQSIRTAWRLT